MNKAVFLSLSMSLSGILVLCCIVIGLHFGGEQRDERVYDEIKPIPSIVSETTSNEDTAVQSEVLNRPGIGEIKLYSNPDCIGWITIPDTAVDYPVMHTPSDPEYYLRRNYYREYSQSGTPFLDSRCVVGETNLIVYGHNMKSTKMFGSLKNYLNIDYAQSHLQIQLYDEANHKGLYEVFAVFTTDTSDRWYGFISHDSEVFYDEMIRYAKQKSVFPSQLTPVCGDTLLTLSTCYGSDKNGRILIIAKKI